MSNRAIAPQYQGIPDRQIAEAMSEFYLQRQAFKTHSEGDATGLYPPVPAYMSALAIAYLTDEGDIKRQFAMLPESNPDFNAERDGDKFLASYSRVVLGFQDSSEAIIDDLGDYGPTFMGHLVEKLVAKSERAGLRTLGMFTLMTAAEDSSQAWGALVIPRLAFDEMHLDYRQDMLEARRAAGEDYFEEFVAGAPDMRDAAQKIIQGSPETRGIAAMVAATTLPERGIITRAVAANQEHSRRVQATSPNGPNQTAAHGGDRAARRRAEREAGQTRSDRPGKKPRRR